MQENKIRMWLQKRGVQNQITNRMHKQYGSHAIQTQEKKGTNAKLQKHTGEECDKTCKKLGEKLGSTSKGG